MLGCSVKAPSNVPWVDVTGPRGSSSASLLPKVFIDSFLFSFVYGSSCYRRLRWTSVFSWTNGWSRVASRVYKPAQVLSDQLVTVSKLGVSISSQKSLISDSGSAEFAKRFRVRSLTVDLSPISTKALAPSFEWWLGRNRPPVPKGVSCWNYETRN